ncbi:two-component response regulator ARR14-like [Vigna radiata var. radiata]|uniref:Two-component response regulator ARR14-like n=1 Tax=Vigna radiata var. radiata TaxID=3916 RepID=A0A1S3VZM5_VIGRR|nr:two-component response regulator ARR14-like [Vigna radiata var. radiata]XP_022632576.1 two-component response regulator ARR14-like [Vigna radiata var. radiata]
MDGTSSSRINVPLDIPLSLNVLVIDTDPEALEFIKKSCKENDRCKEIPHQAIICSESSMAVDVLENSVLDIDLIVMELHMPKMNGYEFLQYLHENGFDIPFVMMLSKSDGFPWSSLEKAVKLGAIDYFFKPFSGPRLLDLWSPFLKHYMARRKEAKADDTLHEKDDTLHEKDDTDDTLHEKDDTP